MNTLIKIILISSVISIFSGCGVRDLTESEAIGTYICSDDSKKTTYIIKSNYSFVRTAYNGYKTYGGWEINGNQISLRDIGESRISDTLAYYDYVKPVIDQWYGDGGFNKKSCIKE